MQDDQRASASPQWQQADHLAEGLARELKKVAGDLAADLSALCDAVNRELPKAGRKDPASARSLAEHLRDEDLEQDDRVYTNKSTVNDALNGLAPAVFDEDLVAAIARYCCRVRGIEPDDAYWRARVRALRQSAERAFLEQSEPGPEHSGGEIVPAARGMLAERPTPRVPERFRAWAQDPGVIVVLDVDRSAAGAQASEAATAAGMAKAGRRPVGDGTGWSDPAPAVGPAATGEARSQRRSRFKGWRADTSSRLIAGTAMAIVLTVGAFVISVLQDDDPTQPPVAGDRGQPGPTGTAPPSSTPTGKTQDQDKSSPSPKGRPSSTPPQASPRPSAKEPSSSQKPEAEPWPAANFGPWGPMASAHSGLCVDGGVSGKQGAHLYQWQCADGAKNQQWALTEVKADTYQIKNAQASLCLGMRQGPERLEAITTACADRETQLWHFNVNAHQNGWVSGYLRNITYDKCLDVSEESMDNGAEIGPWDCTTHKRNQMFRFLPESL